MEGDPNPDIPTEQNRNDPKDTTVSDANIVFEFNEDEVEVDEVDPAAAASSLIGSLTIDDFFDDFASQIEWGGADYYYKGSLDENDDGESNERVVVS